MTVIRSGWCESVKIKFLSAGFTISGEAHDVTLSVCERACVAGRASAHTQTNGGSEALQVSGSGSLGLQPRELLAKTRFRTVALQV